VPEPARISLSLVTVADEVIASLQSHPEARVRLAAWQEWERRNPTAAAERRAHIIAKTRNLPRAATYKEE
jgi:hypothetical protein